MPSRRITPNEVFVAPARSGASLAPFWRADGRSRGTVFSERIAALLERLEARLDAPEVEAELAQDRLDPVAASELLRQLREARAALGGVLPHRRRLVFEEVTERAISVAGGESARARIVLLYTFWGGTLNRPLAMALGVAPGIAALAGDTDGTDGGGGSPDDPAGAIIDETTLARATGLGLDPAAFLADNDSTGFFSRLGDLVTTGPTRTNVNDFRAIVLDTR